MTAFAPLNQQSEIDIPGNEYLGLFDPAPIPDSDGAKKITRLIEDNAIWLQAEPRQSLSIVLHLFPGSVHRVKDALDMIEWLSGYLWDGGYTPTDTDTSNPTWSWLEGQHSI